MAARCRRLDPFELSKAVDRKLQAIWKLAQLPFQAAPDFLRISRNYRRDTFFGTN